ncbi:MAG: tetratricopeptide repeat protein [Candidatus Anammoxibacter sp.]
MNKKKSFRHSCCLIFLILICTAPLSGCFKLFRGASNGRRIDSLEFKIDELGHQIASIGKHSNNVSNDLSAMSRDKDRLNTGYLQLRKEIANIQASQKKAGGNVSKMKKAVISSQKAIKKIYNRILNVEDNQVEIRRKIKKTSDSIKKISEESKRANTIRDRFEHAGGSSRAESNKKIILDNMGTKQSETNAKQNEAVNRLLIKAKKLVDEGQVEEAVKLYEEILVALPGQLDVYYKLGRIYYGQGMIEKSIETYKEIIALNPEDAEAHSLLGVSYAKSDMIDDAIIELKKALKINPNLAEVHVGLSVAYLKKKMVDESIRENIKAIEIDPNLAKAHKYIGIAYKRKGMPDKAKEEFALYKRLTKQQR